MFMGISHNDEMEIGVHEITITGKYRRAGGWRKVMNNDSRVKILNPVKLADDVDRCKLGKTKCEICELN